MPAATYRLVVNLAGQRYVYPELVFARFEAAQARVADAVRQIGAMGRVTSVELEQRLAVAPSDPAPAWAAGEWMTLQCWGTDVVERILAQSPESTQTLSATERRAEAGLPKFSTVEAPIALAEFGAAEPQAETIAASAPVADFESRWPAFRRTRYALASSTALLAMVLLVNFLWQAEGKPVRFLAMLGTREPVMHDLPFTAAALRSLAPSVGVRAAQTD